jgi:hypothetical protein
MSARRDEQSQSSTYCPEMDTADTTEPVGSLECSAGSPNERLHCSHEYMNVSHDSVVGYFESARA